ncbi:sodium/hydrogen exchanger 6, partial [Tanacetum coccineum]
MILSSSLEEDDLGSGKLSSKVTLRDSSIVCDKGSRIILGWNDDVVDVMIMSQTNQVMHVQVIWRADKQVLFCSFVYADNYYVNKRALWTCLKAHVVLMHNSPWVLMGDFNAALNLKDHSCGGYEPNAAMREFKEIIGNLKFNDEFPGSFAIFQPYRIFDHSPRVLRILREGWNLNVEGFDMYQVVKRLKGLKLPLRKLLHDQGNLHDRVNKLCIELDEVQKPLDRDPTSTTLREDHAHYLVAFKQAKIDIERFLRQKSKVEWLEAGDSNTTYFHKVVKIKCARNRIEMVRDALNVLHEGNEVPEAFVAHYISFLGAAGQVSTFNVENLFTNVLDIHKADFMVQDIMDGEIKDALFFIGDDRASGWRISDNILLMRNYYRKRGPPRCAFKVDIQKTYDIVDWQFLENILVGFGFHPKMVKWIMVCVMGSSFSICVNVMEVLTLILQRKVQNSDEFQYHNLCLVPSIPKSTAFFCNVPNAIKETILISTPFVEGILPVRWPPEWEAWFPDLTNIQALVLHNDCEDVIMWRDIGGVFRPFSVACAWDSIRLQADVVDWFGLRSVFSIIAHIVLAVTTYYLWIERNSRLFKKKISIAEQVVQVICSIVRLKLV